MTTAASTSPTTIGSQFEFPSGKRVANRLFKSAMSEQLGLPDHNPGEGLANVYRQWSEGGCGILISGNIMVDRQHIGEPRNVVLDEKSDLAAFQRWTKAGTVAGNEFWAQLNHPGKQIPAFLNSQPVSPSAVSLGSGLEKAFKQPRALTDSEITALVQRFGEAAGQAKEVGFTGVQIHGAHGYLVSQFLSPLANQRSDRWGGSAENRMRFVLEVYRSIRSNVGADFPVSIKMNSADFMKGGFSEDDSILVAQALAAEGIDLIEVSGGTYESPEMAKETKKESTRKREAFFVDFAEKLRKEVAVPLAVTGGFRSTKGMNSALQRGALDFVGIARPMAIEPAMPRDAINDPEYVIELPHLSTGVKALDLLGAHNITWYEQQIWRMAKNKSPKPNLSPWRTLGATMWSNGKYAFAKRRA